MRWPLCIAALVLSISVARADGREPIRLHPRNPHYFEFRGKPTVLVTSAEHYGALINQDFDFVQYFDTLKTHGLNQTRVFTGAYTEDETSFNIAKNTLAPKPERTLVPWTRSKTPGAAAGGNRFDLTKWNPEYFRRLDKLLQEASARGIVVELVLFTTFYKAERWATSPLNFDNNVNGVGKVTFSEALALKEDKLQAAEEALVRKLVAAARRFDNVYFEICNEPYFAGVTLQWQRRIADVIVAAEKPLRHKHLIAQNIANGTAKIEGPHPAVSLFNFHYATPPSAVKENWSLGKALGDDETGFRGTADEPYRLEGWDFLLAGGAVYSHLDYSFTTEHEDGSFGPLPDKQPGGGGPTMRAQLGILAAFMNGLDFIQMEPRDDLVKGGLPDELVARALAQPGTSYALYVRPKPAPSRDYSVRWTGFLEARRAGPYTVHTESDDGVRLWLDDKLVIDHWDKHPAAEDTAAITLAAGKKVSVRMEYHQSGGPAVARLLWSTGGEAKQAIPSAQLSAPDGKSQGLKGEYFLDRELRTPGMSRTDATVDFDWSGTSPFARGQGPASRPWQIPIELALPPGRYRAEWIDTKQGDVAKAEDFEHAGGTKILASPPFVVDVALRAKKR